MYRLRLPPRGAQFTLSASSTEPSNLAEDRAQSGAQAKAAFKRGNIDFECREDEIASAADDLLAAQLNEPAASLVAPGSTASRIFAEDRAQSGVQAKAASKRGTIYFEC